MSEAPTAPQPEGPSAYIASKLESIISGHSINEDDADWLRALAAPEVPAPVAEPVALTKQRIEQIEERVAQLTGYYHNAWDMLAPGALISAIVAATSPPPAAQEVQHAEWMDGRLELWLTSGAGELNPHTKNLVVRFSRALAAKLLAAEKKYGYSDGWMRKDWMDECRQHLMEHIAKGDPRDVAAYCAFLWHHGESTAPAAQEVPQEVARDPQRGRP